MDGAKTTVYKCTLLVIIMKLTYFQAYKAEFYIIHSLIDIPDTFNKYKEEHVRHALVIANFAVNSFIQEMVSFVKKSISEELREDLAGHNHPARIKAGRRIEEANMWAKMKNPFSKEAVTLQHLLRAVVEDPTNYHLGLPKANPDVLTVHRLCKLIFKMCMENSTQAVQVPFLSTGSSASVFKIAIRYIRQYVIGYPDARQDEFIISAFTNIFLFRKIQSLPWCRPPGRGRASTKPNFQFWCTIGSESKEVQNMATLSQLTGEEYEMQEAIRGVSMMHAEDSNSPYSILSHHWSELHKVMNRTCLPDDWNLKYASITKSERLVQETYKFVEENFDGRKPLHQLALIASVVIARALPKVFSPYTNSNDAGAKAVGVEELTTIVRSVPWIENPSKSRSGCHDALPYVTMQSTFIIALYEEQSPLRKHMALHKTHAMGLGWTRKHGNI
jgi:hypothetical protein